MHRYKIMKVAMGIGNFIFMSIVQKIIFQRPTLPTIIQFGFFVFWFINLVFGVIENFFLTFLVMMLVGGLWGASYTNFLYLANAKIKLGCDMGLTYYERELTINILLIASDIGVFAAILLAFILKSQHNPELILHSPK